MLAALVFLASADQLHRIVIADLALADEAAAGFYHQIVGDQLAMDMSCGNDFQALTVDVAIHVAADDDVGGTNAALKITAFTEADIGLGVDLALDTTVDVQIVGQGEAAVNRAVGCDERGVA